MGFIKNLFKQRLVGLDVGISGIKAVELQLGKRPRLLAYNRIPLPWNAIQPDGEVREAGAVIEAMRTLFASSAFTSKKVAMGASGTGIITKRIVLPRMSKEQLSDQLYWEAEQYIPFNLDDVNLDFAIIGKAPSKTSEPMMEVLLVAAKKDYVDALTSLVSEAGLDLVVMDIQPFALGNVFEFSYGDEQQDLPEGTANVLIDFGAGTTKISVVEKDKTTFTRDIIQCGTSCTMLLAKELGLTLQEAEEKKITEGEDPLQYDIIKTHNDLLVNEISQTLDFFLSQASNKTIQGIYVCGGASQTPGLLENMEKTLAYTVHRLNPIRNIAGSGSKMNSKAIRELSYLGSVAIGLSLRSEGDS